MRRRDEVPPRLARSTSAPRSATCEPYTRGPSPRDQALALVPFYVGAQVSEIVAHGVGQARNRVFTHGKRWQADTGAMRWATRLVEREVELATLEDERRRVVCGELRCVLLTADSGVRKTRLATEFLARNRGRCVALSARGSRGYRRAHAGA